MKKIISVIMIMVLCFSLSGCWVLFLDSDDENAVESIESGSENSEGGFEVNGTSTEKTTQDIVSDGIAERLHEFGMTEDEAQKGREVLLSCGIKSIDGFEPTDPTATVDGLMVFRDVIDKDRTAWFTVDNREIFYVSLNGADLYDTAQGGFLISIDDVHIPESSVSVDVFTTLTTKTENLLDRYFYNSKYYDAWGIGRSDDKYMVQCEVYSSNAFDVNNWVFAKVWYTDNGDGTFSVDGVQIDGVQYDIK